MAKLIADKMPTHKFYVEPFGGAAGVLMAKTPCYNEIYNDLHSGIVNLFRVVRDAEKCNRLIELLNFTPYSRVEWTDCNNTWETETDEIEKARKVFVTLQQNFVGVTRGGAWDCDGLSGKNNKPAAFFNSLENIKVVTKRLQNVTIENKPALEVIDRFDSPKTLIYADPPYLPETWGGKGYKHEMSLDEHRKLLEYLTNCRSMVILSGYPSKFYSETLEGAGWIREDYGAVASSALRSRRNGLKNKPTEVFKRTECLWFSPNAAPKTLWNQAEESEAI